MSDAVPVEKPPLGEPAPVLRPEEAPKEIPSPQLRRPENIVFRKRFALAYLFLAALLGAGVGLAVVFLSRSDDNGATFAQSRWSEWRPSVGGTLGVREIAREVGPRYRTANGQQLVGIIAGPMILRPTPDAFIPVTALLITSGRSGVKQQRIDVTLPEGGVFFQLCGAAPGCVISNDGTAPELRGQLVGRETLELALYTFRYLPEADHVITFLPPPPGVKPDEPEYSRAVYLPRPMLAPLLRVPLSSALPPGPVTLKPGDLSPEQGRTIEEFITPRIFHVEYRPLPDQSAILQLSPIEPRRP